ncbi:unnamed protein product (macronuclear) [Paramecium tetraurelia]|uniref:Protein kinase domain-containing protein n=1 Tax=Paramecium tetraurelia TaxID=5888 RepID=A0C5L9_PARTE|nr:uncharacterized protein GSPATT00035215001 [Paramecium tetraurelia]CAK66086.1 unnamed protein product [Paramecium tetraurelia]|eukprot:XP_001433483.1 hypothetical protein (macronuclear) [Paramecium tetraurelia strain d4-2]
MQNYINPRLKGGFAKVYIGHMFGNEKELVAIKIIDKKKFKNQKNTKNIVLNYIKRESQNQFQLSSPHIVKMIDLIENDDESYFILEYCEGGNLQQKIDQVGIPFEEALLIFKQIVNGYKQIREKNIIHRDLKPENILFSKNIAKIGDFGFSKFLDDLDEIVLQSAVGTPIYAAPEIITRKFSSKVDIWSLGVILFQMLYGQIPNEIKDYLNLKIKNIDYIKFPANKKIPEYVVNIMKKMLDVNPEKRISWDDLFAENLLELIEPQSSEIIDQISESKAMMMKQVLQTENRVESIFLYFIYVSDILKFIQQLMTEVQNLNMMAQFSQAQQFSYSIITIKYMENELKFYLDILKGQNLFSVYILQADFELFRNTDKFYKTFNNFKKNYEIMSQFYVQARVKYDKFASQKTQKEEQKNWCKNVIEALDQNENNQKFCQTFNQVYSQIIHRILQKYNKNENANEDKNRVLKVLIKLLHCLQPLQFSHHKKDAYKIEERLLTTTCLENEFNVLYAQIFNQ